ncbi:DCN1-like protein 5 [Coemansia sp. BCRC 34301]|nr:DCN1-like protein 5 [Coemansia sp. BCRC 34301]
MTTLNSREVWFAEYQDFDRDDGKQLIGPEGFQRLCLALKYDMEGIEPLVLSWKLEAVELGTVEWESWDRTVRAMGVADNAALRRAIDAVVKKFNTDHILYRDFYRKVFDYLKPQKQRLVIVDNAKAVLPVITSSHWLFMRFVEFLEAQGAAIASLTRDQWNLLLDLSKSVDAEFSSYSKDEAWPSLFDEFYDWVVAHPAAPK